MKGNPIGLVITVITIGIDPVMTSLASKREGIVEKKNLSLGEKPNLMGTVGDAGSLDIQKWIVMSIGAISL
jgi:hypothetical protein